MLRGTLVRVCRLSRWLQVEDNDDDDDEMMAVNSDRLVLVKQKNRHVAVLLGFISNPIKVFCDVFGCCQTKAHCSSM